jgi:hypothetical protein
MDADIGKNWTAGSISMPVFSESFGLILGATFGAFPTATGNGTTGYTHTFEVAQSSQHASLTVQRIDGQGNYRHALGMVSSLEISYELGEYLTASVDLIAKAGTTASSTATYVEEAKFRPQDVTVTVADTLAGLGAGTEVKVESATITIEKNAEDYQVHGSTQLEDIFNNRFAYSGTFTLLWNVDTYRDAFKDGTKKAFRFEAVNTSRTVGTGDSTNPSLTFDIAPAVIEEWSREDANDTQVRQTVGFTGIYSLSDEKSIEAVLVNETDEY